MTALGWKPTVLTDTQGDGTAAQFVPATDAVAAHSTTFAFTAVPPLVSPIARKWMYHAWVVSTIVVQLR